jgi:hypothetical protein
MTARTHPPDKPVYTSVDQCLADVDSFANWLQGECFQAPIVEPLPLPTSITPNYSLVQMMTPQLLAFIFSLPMAFDEVLCARNELANRWLAHNRTEGNL